MTGLLVSLLVTSVLPHATIEVNVRKRQELPVPRNFFGQFGEHLGCNVYNGFWAQILRNPSFEGVELYEREMNRAKWWTGNNDVEAIRDLGVACYWQPVGKATYALDAQEPFNSSHSQRIEVKEEGGVEAPVFLPVHRCLSYEWTWYARSENKLSCTAQVRSQNEAILWEKTLDIHASQWTRYEVHPVLPDGCQKGERTRFVLLFQGQGTVWLDQSELFPSDHIDGLDPDMVGLMRDLRVSLLRFPGGNFVSGYHWRDGIGLREKRVTLTNPAWRDIVELNHVGTDEWIRFAEAIGAEPLICVNAGNGTPQDAADWVRYCNESEEGHLGSLRADNGHPKPYGVRYWEVGNELWGNWQVGHCTPEEYAQRYDDFSQAMLEADPSILLIANGGPGDWNERFLKAVTQPVRSLGLHRLRGNCLAKDASPEDLCMSLSTYGLFLDKELSDLKRLLKELGTPQTKVAITELMSVSRRPGGPSSHSRHMENLYFAGVMNACIRHRDLVELITRTAVCNHGGGRAKILEISFPEPVHFLSEIYGTMSGRFPAQCDVSCETFNSPQLCFDIPMMENVPVLECMALLDEKGKKLILLMTNRDAHKEHEAKIKLKGFRPETEALTRTLAGPPDAFNVWNEPSRVHTVKGSLSAGKSFQVRLAPSSITEIVLQK